MNKILSLLLMLAAPIAHADWWSDKRDAARKKAEETVEPISKPIERAGQTIDKAYQRTIEQPAQTVIQQGTQPINSTYQNGSRAIQKEIGQVQNQLNQYNQQFQNLQNQYHRTIQNTGEQIQNSVEPYSRPLRQNANDLGRQYPGTINQYQTQIDNGTRNTINQIDHGVRQNIDSIRQESQQAMDQAIIQTEQLGREIQHLNQYDDSAARVGAALEKVRQTSQTVQTPIGGVDPTPSPQRVRAWGTKALTKGVPANTAEVVENLRENISDVSTAGENALSDLRQFDPDEIFDSVQSALDQNLNDELKRKGMSYNFESGELDLRNTRIGKKMQFWLDQFVQGNQGEGRVEVFSYNMNTQELLLRLYARHRQSTGQSVAGKPVDLYSVTQHAKFWYDFEADTGDFEIDPGKLAPRFSSKTYRQLSHGDLLAAAESSAPSVANELMHFERTNQYEQRLAEYRADYGNGNVYFASKNFAEWAAPQTLAKYFVNGVLTAGTSVYPQIMADARAQAEMEIPDLTRWLQQRGIENAKSVAMQLLTGQSPRWPFLKFEIIPIRYSAREKPLNASTTPWRHVNHLAFVIIWANAGANSATPARQALE